MAMTPEGRVKQQIKAVLKRRGVWFYMPIQNGMGVVGLPDFICCAYGQFLGIEAKAPGKHDNLTPNQKRVQREILDHQGHHLVISDILQLEEYLSSHF